MVKYDVIVIGGGATGTGILRDLSMRGVKALLIEQRDLAYGTSSRFHGLLHSGGRYAVKDPEAARECIEENQVLRKIGAYCVEPTEGFFVRTEEDNADYEHTWVEACRRAGIPAEPVAVKEARRCEPELSPRIQAAYRVPDAAIDGFRLVWQNAASARRYGGEVRTYTELTAIDCINGRVNGIEVCNALTGEKERIACELIVNAAGSWVGRVAKLAGLPVTVQPDRGTLIAFNHRLCSRVVNRLRPPSDADIFVPHGTVTILGTTSVPTSQPDDFATNTEEVMRQLAVGKVVFNNLDQYRILRVFAGTRPIYDPGGAGRNASRNFTIIDHAATDGLRGMISVVGGKLTTYRLMAEKTADKVCGYLGVKTGCRTAEEPLVAEVAAEVIDRARRRLPAAGLERAVARLGQKFAAVTQQVEKDPRRGQLVCECEMVTTAELEMVAKEDTTFTIDDIRRKTRMGMGTCQGAFCTLRSVGIMADLQVDQQGCDTAQQLKDFLQARWAGIRPVLWGHQMREAELTRAIYAATLNIDGAIDDEKK
jgi:glycerol-3-phosphate dehydrogenase